MRKPIVADLCCGLGGWTDGFLANGWHARGYDIEAHEYGDEKYPGELVIRSILDMHGSELADCDLIVASPPCTEYSYMAMPWTRAKQIAAGLRGQGEFPDGYRGSRTVDDLNALFNACFRIQREASEAAGKKIPMVVENVRGAQPWVGRAWWNYGSYYLWGDVPLLIPAPRRDATKRPGRTMCYPAGSANPDAVKGRTGKLHWQDEPDDGRKNPGFRFDGSGRSFQTESVERHVDGLKVPSDAGRSPAPGNGARFTSRDCGVERPEEGTKLGGSWFHGYKPGVQGPRNHGPGSNARKAASAKIAKIPFALSSYVAEYWKP